MQHFTVHFFQEVILKYLIILYLCGEGRHGLVEVQHVEPMVIILEGLSTLFVI